MRLSRHYIVMNEFVSNVISYSKVKQVVFEIRLENPQEKTETREKSFVKIFISGIYKQDMDEKDSKTLPC